MIEKQQDRKGQKALFDKSDILCAGYLVLSAKAVRGFLAKGVVRVPREQDVFATEQDLPQQGRRFLTDTDLDSPLSVIRPKDGCVAEVTGDFFGDDDELLDQSFPATGITKLIFATEREASDWLARSRSFSGLGPLPEVEAREGLIFKSSVGLGQDRPGLAAHESLTSECPSEDNSEAIDLDHLAGGVVTLLETGFAGFKWMRRLESAEVVNRATLASSIAEEMSEDLEKNSARVNGVLSILQEPQWNRVTGLFDPQAMLDRFVENFSDDLADEGYNKKIMSWSEYVRAILNGTGDARSNGFLDSGDIFLRALELLLRTSPMFVARIDEQEKVYGVALGQKVYAIARILAGWYQGFGDLAGAAKEAKFYSIGCSIVAGSEDCPVSFSVLSEDEGFFDTKYLLCASDSALSEYLASPPNAIKGFFHNAQIATEQVGWEVSYCRKDLSIHFTRESDEIVGTVVDDSRVRLQIDLKLRRKGARTWLKGFQDELLKLSYDLRCTPSSPAGYPDLLLHCHQLISTTDHDEILDHLEALAEGKKRLLDIHGRLVGERSAAT
jgi:hypothetical protein